MPQTANMLPVSGTVAADSDSAMLVLAHRLDGYDTFLTGRLELGGRTVAVRILTFDDVTVLRLTDQAELPPETTSWSGVLHLPHGWRPGVIPDDLATAATMSRRDLTVLDHAELRYALTFLGEATTDQIRRDRISTIVSALPELTEVRA